MHIPDKTGKPAKGKYCTSAQSNQTYTVFSLKIAESTSERVDCRDKS